MDTSTFYKKRKCLSRVLERELEESDHDSDSDGLEEIVDYGEYCCPLVGYRYVALQWPTVGSQNDLDIQ